MGLLQSKGPKPMKQVYVKPIKQDNSSPPNYGNSDTQSKIPVADIAFGSTISANFFTLLSLILVIISIIDLVLTFEDTTLPGWNPKITGIIGVILSAIISGSLMLISYRKMNATVTPLNV